MVTGFFWLLALGIFNPVFAVGSEALLINPANLGIDENPTFSCRFLDLGGGISNNSFNFAQYNRYTGEFIDDKGKQWLFNSVPQNGLQFGATLSGGMLRFSKGNWAGFLKLDGEMGITVPRDLVGLLLNGNEIGRTFDSRDGGGEVLTTFSCGGGVGKRLKNFTFGATLKYLRGLFYTKIINYDARFITTREAFAGDGCVGYIRAQGGNGFAGDFGVTYSSGKFYAGLAILNLSPGLVWKERIEEVYCTFKIDSTNLYDLVRDSGNFYYRLTRITDEEFFTQLPVTTNIGIGYRLARWVKTGVIVTPVWRPELSALRYWRAEWHTEAVLEKNQVQIPVSGMFGFDRRWGVIFGLGSGIVWKGWNFNFEMREMGGVLALGKGGEIRIGFGYVFPNSPALTNRSIFRIRS